MSVEFQGNLFDTADRATLGSLAATRRTPLTHDAWVDVRPNWVAGADAVLEALLTDVPWSTCPGSSTRTPPARPCPTRS